MKSISLVWSRLPLALLVLLALAGCTGDDEPSFDKGQPNQQDGTGGSASGICKGCQIGARCFPEGSENPENSCQVCRANLDDQAWTDRPSGASCEDGRFCTSGDTCQAGKCQAGAKDPCDDGVSCTGAETCDEQANSCGAGVPTCGSGELCDPIADVCGLTCDGCAIDGVCYPDGTANPRNECEVCSVDRDPFAFVSKKDGTSCNDGTFCNGEDVCQAGICVSGTVEPCDDGVDCNGQEVCNEGSNTCSPGVSTCAAGTACDLVTSQCTITCAGCVVDDICYATGSPNPQNSCEICDVNRSKTSFSSLADGVACDNGVFCDGTDTCQAGVCAALGQNPSDDGVACNGTEICFEATDRCGSGTPTCGAGTSCAPTTDTCELTCAGCLVGGVCYANGSPNPLNSCETCQISQSTTTFVALEDGSFCNDGLFCNGMDSCQAGVCTASGLSPCSDGITCNGSESCNESTDSCSPGASTCGAGKYCDVTSDTCMATCGGCSIGGVCYPDGIPNPTNPCEVCSVVATDSAWSVLPNGTTCGYNAVCGGGDCECAPGWVQTGGYCSTRGVEASDETWGGTVYSGIQALFPKVNLLSDDINHVGDHSELVIVGVNNAVNGAVSMVGANVVFTASGVGPASFVYLVQAGSDPNTQVEVTVSFDVLAAPSVIAVSDSRTVQQGDTLPITAASLLANDVGTSLTVISVHSPVKGAVSLVGTAITFLSTGLAGEPAEFEYTIQNGVGVQSTGKVFITATPLPGVAGYIYDDFLLFNAKRTTYQPPTVRSIFDTWARFNANVYFANGMTATGTAASWTLIADENNNGNIDGDLDGNGIQDDKSFFTSGAYTVQGDINGDGTFDARFMQTANGTYNGFLSPESYENYNHEVTLWSLDQDDDMIGVALAYTSGGGAGVLHVDRTTGGVAPQAGWGLALGTTVLVNFGVDGVFTNGSGGNGWSGKASRVKVVREGDLIRAYCTNWMHSASGFFSPPAYNPDSLIEIDLSQTTNNIRYSTGGVLKYVSHNLTAFRGARPYGYVNSSQALSSYIDVKFDGGIQSDVLVYLKSKQPGLNIWTQSEVWRYLSGSWTMTAESAQDVFGFVRPVTEPETGNVYQVKATEVEKL